MNLYQLNSEIESILGKIFESVDQETGEINEDSEELFDALDLLKVERNEKIENIACFIKNMNAEAAAIKAEEEALAKRRKQNERKAEAMKNWLEYCLNGEKFSSARCAISFRSSEAVEILDPEAVPKKYLVRQITFKPDKKAIKEMLKQGQKIKGCKLLTRSNVQIK